MVRTAPPIVQAARIQQSLLPRTFCRHKSLTASIESGRHRKAQPWEGRGRRTQGEARDRNVKYDKQSADSSKGLSWAKRTVTDDGSRVLRQRHHRDERRERQDNTHGSRDRMARDAEDLPYTTAASQFLYGSHAVRSAMRMNRRKIYKLYVLERITHHGEASALIARARNLGVEVAQGFILETSPLPLPPIRSLGSSSISDANFDVSLEHQSREETEVNGTATTYPYKASKWRHPLVLYLDSVLDEGNLGAIARSAYYLGVDAIITPTHRAATWGNIAVKASAGATEVIPLFKAKSPATFLSGSVREGWRLYASMPLSVKQIPPNEGGSGSNVNSPAPSASVDNVVYTLADEIGKRLPSNHCPVQSHPTILMMGNEETGIQTSLLNLAHYHVGIRSGQSQDQVGIDSLNVSVATALLCGEMLKAPREIVPPEDLLF